MLPQFVIANLGIFVGYLLIGIFVLPGMTEFVRRLIPGVNVSLRYTTLGGFFFFMTCGLTHLEMVLHTVYWPQEENAESMLAWHSVLIHDIQVIAVWTLILGVVFEFLKPVTEAIVNREKVG